MSMTTPKFLPNRRLSLSVISNLATLSATRSSRRGACCYEVSDGREPEHCLLDIPFGALSLGIPRSPILWHVADPVFNQCTLPVPSPLLHSREGRGGCLGVTRGKVWRAI